MTESTPKNLSRRDFLKIAGATGATISLAGGLGSLLSSCEKAGSAVEGATTTGAGAEKLSNPDGWKPANLLEKPDPSEALTAPFEKGKYETFPRQVMATDIGLEGQILQHIDIGTLGPDVDTIVGVDFPGLIKSGAAVAHFPKDGNPTETRVVFIKRTDLETVQVRAALGGDRFDVHKASEYGGDAALDVTAKMHAFNTSREHQVVYYLGDLGKFEEQYGAKEQELLQRIIRAQRPSKAGISEPDFVQSRIYVPTK